jgi:hypothetical protein
VLKTFETLTLASLKMEIEKKKISKEWKQLIQNWKK